MSVRILCHGQRANRGVRREISSARPVSELRWTDATSKKTRITTITSKTVEKSVKSRGKVQIRTVNELCKINKNTDGKQPAIRGPVLPRRTTRNVRRARHSDKNGHNFTVHGRTVFKWYFGFRFL